MYDSVSNDDHIVRLATYEAKALPKRKPHKEERIRRLTSKLFSLKNPSEPEISAQWLYLNFSINQQLQKRHTHKILQSLTHNSTEDSSRKNSLQIEFGVREDVEVFTLGELSGSLKNVFSFLQTKISIPFEHKVELVPTTPNIQSSSGSRPQYVLRLTLTLADLTHLQSQSLNALLAHIRTLNSELHWSENWETAGATLAIELSPTLVQLLGASDLVPPILRPLLRKLQSECSLHVKMDNVHEADASSVEFAWNSLRMFVKSYLKDVLVLEETHAVIKNIYFNAVEVLSGLRSIRVQSAHGVECGVLLNGVPTIELLPTREELKAFTNSSLKHCRDALMLSNAAPEEELTFRSLKPQSGHGLKHVYASAEADLTPLVQKAMARMHDEWLRVPFDSFLRSKFSIIEPSKEHPQQQRLDLYVTEYAPMMFHTLRSHYGIPITVYAEALQYLEHRQSEGKSRCDFFVTRSGQFLVKALQKKEFGSMKESLVEYFQYMMKAPDSLLTKYCGLYKIVKVDGTRLRLLVMHTIFRTMNVLHEKYDLKGSAEGRKSTLPASPHPKTTASSSIPTLRDLDMQIRICLADCRGPFLAQLDADTKFLESLNLMDYSLLVGVHDTAKVDVYDPKSPYLPHFGRPSAFSQLSDSRAPNRQYFIGVIDFLQVWDMRKQLEGTFKGFLYAKEISSVPPSRYRERFMKYISELIV